MEQEYSVPAGERGWELRSPTCPEGSRIASGGYRQLGSRAVGLDKLDAYPSLRENLYLMGVNNTSPSAITLRVFGICFPG